MGYDGENYKASLDGLINALLPVGGAVGAFFSSNKYLFTISKDGLKVWYS